MEGGRRKKSGRRKNGHKMTCSCPICINMKHCKRGGGDAFEDVNFGDETHSLSDENLAAPVDNGQAPAPTFGGKRKRKSSGKKGNGHKLTCSCPICKNMAKHKRGGSFEVALGIEGEPEPTRSAASSSSHSGKKSARGKKRSNGHKATCACPICKNMAKHKSASTRKHVRSAKHKTRRHRRRSSN